MITIAVSIGAEQVRALERVRRQQRKVLGKATSRSHLVRLAVDAYLRRLAREEQEERDREVYARHKRSLARQARALVDAQARG
jgi:hypothetical protein